MRRITSRVAVVAAVLFAVAGGTVAVSAVSSHFGYHKIRDGLPSGIAHFSLTSTDIRQGRPIPSQFWGCDDPGVSPELSWSGAPAGTRSYAVIVFDPDAPTGSGFWHWIAWDIPASATSLPTGATLPPGAVSGINDGGTPGYTGPCPPEGDITHHYQFKVIALDVPSLQRGPNTEAAVVGFVIGRHAIGSAMITATARQ